MEHHQHQQMQNVHAVTVGYGYDQESTGPQATRLGYLSSLPANVVPRYPRTDSTAIGIILIVVGALISILHSFYASDLLNAGLLQVTKYGILTGILVSCSRHVSLVKRQAF